LNLKAEDGERHAFLGWGGDVASGDLDEVVGKKPAVDTFTRVVVSPAEVG
jgi:hypothetical protein